MRACSRSAGASETDKDSAASPRNSRISIQPRSWSTRSTSGKTPGCSRARAAVIAGSWWKSGNTAFRNTLSPSSTPLRTAESAHIRWGLRSHPAHASAAASQPGLAHAARSRGTGAPRCSASQRSNAGRSAAGTSASRATASPRSKTCSRRTRSSSTTRSTSRRYGGLPINGSKASRTSGSRPDVSTDGRDPSTSATEPFAAAMA
jgi:hypothetical protein